MKIAPQLEREIAHLSEEDYKKIFPEQYYQKYAAHHVPYTLPRISSNFKKESSNKLTTPMLPTSKKLRVNHNYNVKYNQPN